MPELHLEVLPAKQSAVWKLLGGLASDFKRHGFYLAGGTALALQLGHRQSVDFDFFSPKPGTGDAMRQRVEAALPDLVLRETDADTVHAQTRGVRLSMIGAYRHPLIGKPVVASNGIALANICDIALMKLVAISHRATVRDYVDLAAVIRSGVSLEKLLKRAPGKFGRNFNRMIPLRALVSFEDLDPEMPRVLDPHLTKIWRQTLQKAVKAVF